MALYNEQRLRRSEIFVFVFDVGLASGSPGGLCGDRQRTELRECQKDTLQQLRHLTASMMHGSVIMRDLILVVSTLRQQ